ncbi:hypothetical protein [Streptomyces sp. NPDC001100]
MSASDSLPAFSASTTARRTAVHHRVSFRCADQAACGDAPVAAAG